MSRNALAFAALIAEAQRLGWPARHENDLLVHDAYILGQADLPEGHLQYGQLPEGRPFGWVLRESGTHLCYVPEARRDGWSADRDTTVGYFLKYPNEAQHHRYYWWSDETLSPLSGPLEMAERLDKEHRRTVRLDPPRREY